MQEDRLLGFVTLTTCSFEQARSRAGSMVRKSNKTEFKISGQTALGLEADASCEATRRTLYFTPDGGGLALLEITPRPMSSSRLIDLMSTIDD